MNDNNYGFFSRLVYIKGISFDSVDYVYSLYSFCYHIFQIINFQRETRDSLVITNENIILIQSKGKEDRICGVTASLRLAD